MERLEIVITALSTISDSLEGDDDDLQELRSSVEVARNCCQALQLLWQHSIDDVEGVAPNETGYHVPRVVEGCGHPRAVISLE